ncbi:DUF6443 domain-containing protein [uncultured Croceitalea sp.]|uniref:DUF6443 domain-containing protein n=1 Tax=uncultured Croceitalea sp. TaxID=1798908 RepID=UPI00374F6D81
MILNKIKRTIIFTSALLISSTVFSQFIGGGGNGSYALSGPSPVNVGETKAYTITGTTGQIATTFWRINSSYGTIVSSTNTTASVYFTGQGSVNLVASIQDYNGNGYLTPKTITINVSVLPGSISGAQTICYGGNPGTLSNSVSASGGSGSYSYQWQYSNNGSSGWSNIGGATSTSYNPPGGLTASRWYRRRVISGGETKYTNSVKVTVRSNLSAGGVSGTQTVCYAGNPGTLGNGSSPSGGNGSYSYQWQYSNTSGTSGFSNVGGATSSSYNPPSGLTASRWYRRRVISCGQTKYTLPVKVTVNPALSSGSIGGTQTICYNGNPSTLSSSSNASGGNSSYSYQWQYSNNGSSGWANISGATSTSYTPPNGLTASRWYRRRVISCSQTKYTGSVKVTVAIRVSIPTTPSITNNCGSTVLTRSNPPNGITWYWQSSISGTSTSSSGSSVTRTSGTIYYLRGRNSSGCWGTTRTVNYTVNQSSTWYADSDGDGQGNPSSPYTGCSQPSGYVTNNSDYNDSTVMITNLAPQTFYSDVDGDGFGDGTTTISASFMPLGYATNNTDPCPNAAGTGNGCPSYSTALSDENYAYTKTYQDENADQTIESVSYFDGLGRTKQQVVVRGSGTGGAQPNLATGWTMDWSEGSGSTGFFNQNGATIENKRNYGPNPFGETALIWECGNQPDNHADGGWNTDYFNVDKTKTYRYTVWVRRNHSQNGTTYHGTQNVDNLGGGANGNPYFWAGDLPQLNEWYLLVGVIHPYNHGGGDTGVSGVYDMQGNKVIDGSEFKWRSNTTTSRFRNYLYYCTDVNVRQYFYSPVLEVVDGNEQSLAGMFDNGVGKDIVTHMEYDAYGRHAKEWLPHVPGTGNAGSYRVGDMANGTQAYYKARYADDFIGLSTADVNAYSEKEFEASPLNRVMKQAAPGKDWKLASSGNDNAIELNYQANGSNEVRYFEVTTSFANNTYTPSLVQSGYYMDGELYKMVTKDENHDGSATKDHTTEEFTNKMGQVVLKRTYDGGVAHDTYYVYDNYGNLTYVIPPKVTTGSVSTTELNELCYQYKYDHRNRLVEKKIPGKGWEYIVYNKLDQPVMTQDPNLDAQNKWLFTKYDAFGRVAYTGIINNANDRDYMVSVMEGASDEYVTRTSSATVIGGIDVYYTNDAKPNNIHETYTINYYDSYVDTDGLSVPATVLGQAKATNTQGLATVSKVRVLGTNDWITTITGYDVKGRPIYTASKNNYLSTIDIVESRLDFTGRVLETKTTHTKGTNPAIVTTDLFDYDTMGRMTSQRQTINGQAQQTIVENGYDELGQLTAKTVGGGLQTVDYDYNVRGWLKRINNTASLGNDLFAFDINYNTADHGATALYNGNISETEWRTANDNTLRWYHYGYDALNRITSATDNTGNYNLYDLTYDKNGNILSLKRKGNTNAGATSFGTMDNLTYHYSSGEVSNKLLRVRDWTTNVEGFKDSASPTSDDYTYDANGNMLRDLNKGINTNIGYNHLNLPTSVTLSGGTISYIYDATGVKLKKTVGSSVTEYAGNYIYENGNLQFFSHAEGYVDVEGGYDYIYQYKDHLGNVRLSYTDNNGTLEIIEENNYYPFGLKHKGYNASISPLGNDVAQRWKFGGKELNDELNLDWYDVSARNYDPAIGRWMNLDPLAEQMRRHSPYNYAFDNPVFFTDPDGMMPVASSEYCPSCETQEDWDNYQAQIDNTATGQGYDNATHMALNNDNMQMTINEDGNQILMVNGSPVDLDPQENRISAFGDFFMPLIEGAPKAIANLFKGKSSTQTVKAADEVIDAASTSESTGGRLGKESTRQLNGTIADDLESRGFEITGGGNRLPEEYIPAADGGRKGSAYPDITAIKDGKTLRINTVDTYTSGRMTGREARNALKIRTLRPNDHLVTIPKRSVKLPILK